MSKCVICGSTASIGSESCAEGKICRRCWNKMSENLNGIRSLSARKLRAHVAYREQNMRLYNQFAPTSVSGGYDVLHVDAEHKLFAVSLETSSLNYKPDIFKFDELLGYCLDVKDENGSTTSLGEGLRPEAYKHRATCRFTPPPELPTVRNGETVPPELRYLDDGERDTWVSVYLYLNNPWVPFIRMFVTKRPTGCYGTRSYNKAVSKARGIISLLKDILSETGTTTVYAPSATAPVAGNKFGPNPVYRMPAPPAYNNRRTSYVAQSYVAPYVPTARKQLKCPVCGAVGQTGNACEYCGTKLR